VLNAVQQRGLDFNVQGMSQAILRRLDGRLDSLGFNSKPLDRASLEGIRMEMSQTWVVPGFYFAHEEACFQFDPEVASPPGFRDEGRKLL
jgi:hypothetical protein